MAVTSTRFPRENWTELDAVLLGLLLAVSLSLTVFAIRWHDLPAEDSLMLLRYEQHLIHGQGIVWNIGERPVEGATDFLFLLLLAVWIKLTHLQAILAARTLLAAAHVATVGWLFWALRRVFGAPRILASILALYLATGPGILHASNGFSPPLYALATLIAWTYACSMVMGGTTQGEAWRFALAALVCGLIRPDGVVLATFMVIALIYLLRGAAWKVVSITVTIFTVFGGAYFVWRLHYFGYLLPNPFYKKYGGQLHPSSLRGSISTVFKMLMPVVPIYVTGLATSWSRRRTLFTLVPVVLFAMVWVLLTPENNVDSRFQYVVLPMGLLSVGLIWDALRREATQHSWSWSATMFRQPIAMLVVFATLPMDVAWWRALFPPDPVGTGNYNIAVALSKFEQRHYTMAVTEAGVVPYFSRWRTIDAWGLNDSTIVHDQHGLTEQYLEANHPAVLMFYLKPSLAGGQNQFENIWKGIAPTETDISKLLAVMSHFAVTHDYQLAARWGVTPCAVHIWYVRRDIPDAQQLVTEIQKRPHFFAYGNELAENYLGADAPAQCSNQAATIGLEE